MRRLFAAVAALVLPSTCPGQSYTISTFAGGGLPVNIAATSATLTGPQSVAVDKSGNVFFADSAAHIVLRMDAASGILTLVAGNGSPGFSGDNGLAVNAQLNYPQGLAIDASGALFIADLGNNRIRRVANGVIATVAGNGLAGFSGENVAAAAAPFDQPHYLAVDASGALYVSETRNNRVRRIAAGRVSTYAGGGSQTADNVSATSAALSAPEGLAIDSQGNLYIAESGAHRVRVVSAGKISTFAGSGKPGFSGDNGPALIALLNGPDGLAVDASGNLYIADANNGRIRMVSGGTISTIEGNGGYSLGDNGPATSAGFAGVALAAGPQGALYIADTSNRRIRRVSNGTIATVAGTGPCCNVGDNGPAASAILNYPGAVAVDSTGALYIADYNNYRIRKVSNGVVTTVAGNGTPGYSGDGGPATAAQLYTPWWIALDSANNLYISDTESHRVRMVSNGVITTIAGNGVQGFAGDGGPANMASFDYPAGVAVDASGNLFIADFDNNRVRKVSGGVVTTVAGNGIPGFAGDGGPATAAELYQPFGIAVDPSGNLYIADNETARVRKVSGGTIATVAGNGTRGFSGDNGLATAAQLAGPYGLAASPGGDLFITDTFGFTGDLLVGAYESRVRKISGGMIGTIAGIGVSGFAGDGGPGALSQLNAPQGVAVDQSGNVYVADAANNRIRILMPGTPPAIAPNGVSPIFSAASTIQSGEWVSIYGSNLASATAVWNGDFPTVLGGVTVTIANQPAYLWFVSPTQINLQVPDGIPAGPVTVAVTTPSGATSTNVTLAAQAPSLSLLGDGRHVAAQIANLGGTFDLAGPANTFTYTTRPVRAGETLVLYGVGFGPTSPAILSGLPYSGQAPTVNPVTVTIGGAPATVGFQGMIQAGLYQINVTVPAGLASGDQQVVATVNGVRTPIGPVVAIQ